MMSMTGFGRAATAAAGKRIVVEVRSVNHRNLEVKVRGRAVDAGCELEIIRAVRAGLGRGAVFVTVEEEDDEGLGLSSERMRALYQSLEALRRDLGVAQPIDLGTLAVFLRALKDRGADRGLPWEDVRPAVEEALSSLQAMRSREGEALALEMKARLRQISDLVARLHEAVQPLPERAARRLEQRVAALARQVGVDAGRLAQEIAIAAERLDVTEELARLDVHLPHLEQLIEARDPGREGVGRRLEFLLQEVGRELNTLGAKSQDAGVAALVVDAKAELEKIREQAQNVE
jgi:uncharacterized protein (TIGR00255 family)